MRDLKFVIKFRNLCNFVVSGGGHLICFLVFFLLTILDGVALNRGCGGWSSWLYNIGQSVSVASFITSFSLLLGRFRRIVLIPAFVYFFVTDSVNLFTSCCFGQILGGDWFLIVAGSSFEEVKSFFWHYVNARTIVLCGCWLVILGIGVIFLKRYRHSTSRIGMICAILLSMLSVIWEVMYYYRNPVPVWNRLAATKMIGSTFHVVKEYRKVQQCLARPELNRELRCSYQECRPVVLFVIGESATRSNWSAYGYGRNTTPNIDRLKDELILFSDVVSCYPHTAKAIRMLLTEETLETPGDVQCTLAELARRAGYHTVLVSNQNYWGDWNENGSMLFHACHKSILLSRYGRPGSRYDSEVLQPVREQLKSTMDCPLLVFIHLMGSHVEFADRYPAASGRFNLSDRCSYMENYSAEKILQINHYDNSIAFTDTLLGQLIDMLKHEQRPSMLFYISDHGESPRAASWRRVTDPDVWKIPMFFWFSDGFAASHTELLQKVKRSSDRHLQSDLLFPGLVEWLGIVGYGDNKRSFMNVDFVERSTDIYQEGGNTIHLEMRGR